MRRLDWDGVPRSCVGAARRGRPAGEEEVVRRRGEAVDRFFLSLLFLQAARREASATVGDSGGRASESGAVVSEAKRHGSVSEAREVVPTQLGGVTAQARAAGLGG